MVLKDTTKDDALHGELERIVQERTVELLKQNRQLMGEIEDLTRMEGQLRRSEEKYRHIFENIQDIYYEIGLDGVIQELSPSVEKITKYTRDELIGTSVYDIYAYPDERDTLLRIIRKSGVVTDYEISLKDRDGRIFTVSLYSRLVFDDNGDPIKILGSLRDITKRKSAEEALRESEIKYRSIFETTAAATVIIDEDTKISLVNNAFEKLSGISKKEMEGKRSWTEFVVRDDLPRMREYHRARRIDSSTAPRNYEFRFVDKDGLVKDAFMTIALIPETKKSVASILDITARKRAEDALRESEQRLTYIIDFLPDATFAIDRDGRVIAWNRAMEEMTGTRAEDILDKGNYEYSVPFYGYRRPMLIDLIFTSDKEIEKEYHFIKKEGDILLAESNVPLKGVHHTLWAKASPLYDSKGAMVGAIESVRDITDRKRAEKALKKREKELEVKTRNLEELNTALKVLLRQREADKEDLAERTLSNVKHLVLPYIEKLKKGSLDAKDEAYIGIVESNLREIVSPFSQRLSSKYMTLTPKELQVANLIKDGRTTKEIAELLNASLGTIDFHRHNIRNKLNLKNKRANLRSYLLTLA